MKKLVIVLLLLAVPALAADLPAPFQKAKELAISRGRPLDAFGSKMVDFSIPDGSSIRIIATASGGVGIGTIKDSGDVEAIIYEDQTFTLLTWKSGLGNKEVIDLTKAQEVAFKVFRVLVANNLI